MARACAGPMLLAVVAVVASGGSAPGASSSVTVTMDVTSHTAITNECRSSAAWDLGTVLPGVPATTSTGSDVCRVRFTSSNDTAALRIYQADREGTAMASATPAWDVRQTDQDYFNDVDAGSDGTVIAVGTRGNVRASTDSGATFPTGQVNTAGSWESFNAVDIVDAEPQVAWIAAHSGVVLRSSDGGGTWAIQPAGTSGHLYAVLSASSTTAFVGGSSGTVLRTTTSGSSWSAMTSGTTSSVKDFARRSDADMWFAGNNNTVRRSIDGGATWNAPAATPTPWSHWEAVAVTGTSTVWLAGTADGRVAVSRSVDHGATWASRSTWLGEPIDSMVAISDLEAYVVGRRGTMLHTTDGGTTWTRRVPPSTESLSGIARAADGNLVVATFGERLLRTANGSSWASSYAGGTTAPLNDVAAAPTDRRIVVAVGDSGLVQRSTDRGATWTASTAGTSEHLRSVSIADDGFGWAVGHGGTIRRTTDAGATWSSQASPSTADLFSVDAVSSRVGWASGRGGVVLRTTDGGATWSLVSSGTLDLYAISAVDASVAWIGGVAGTTRLTTDGGATWTVRDNHQSASIYDLHAISASDAFGVNYWTGYTRTTDGGATWSEGLHSGGPKALAVIGDRPVAAVSEWGRTDSSADGGATWASHGNPGHYSHQRGVAAIDANRFVAVGENESISVSRLGAAISDFGGAGSVWDGATSGLFGVCMQAVGAGTTPVWTVDAGNVPGQCEPLAGDSWSAVPTVPTTVASVGTPGVDGTVDLVWGAQPRSDQPPGSYSATITFEAIAPAA